MNDSSARENRRPFPERFPETFPRGRNCARVMSANNERESFADYKLDYPLGRRGRALNPAYRRVFLSEGRKSFSLEGTGMRIVRQSGYSRNKNERTNRFLYFFKLSRKLSRSY